MGVYVNTADGLKQADSGANQSEINRLEQLIGENSSQIQGIDQLMENLSGRISEKFYVSKIKNDGESNIETMMEDYFESLEEGAIFILYTRSGGTVSLWLGYKVNGQKGAVLKIGYSTTVPIMYYMRTESGWNTINIAIQ